MKVSNQLLVIMLLLWMDLQDDPAEFCNLIESLEKGWDLVSGWKKTG